MGDYDTPEHLLRDVRSALGKVRAGGRVTALDRDLMAAAVVEQLRLSGWIVTKGTPAEFYINHDSIKRK